MANSSHPSLRLSDRNEKAKNKTRGTRYSNIGNLRVITGQEKTKKLKSWPVSQNNETCEISQPIFPQNQFLQYPQQIPQPVYPQQIPQTMYPQQMPQSMYPQQMPQPGVYLQNQMPQPEYMQSQISPSGYLYNQVSQVNVESYNHPQMEASPTFRDSITLLSDKAENLPRRQRQRGKNKGNNRSRSSHWLKPVDTSDNARNFWQKRNRYGKKQKYESKSQQITYAQKKYKWYNKKYKSAYEKLSNTLMDNLDEVSDGPLEEDFEEVEVASGSDDNKNNEVSVGFRKSKPLYLKGRACGFFKPKVVKFSEEKMFVKCTNAENKVDVEELVDLVSDVEDVDPDPENVIPELETVNPDLEDDKHDPEVNNQLIDDNLDPEEVNIDLDLEDISDAEYEEVGADSDEFLNENMLIIDDDEEDSEQNISQNVDSEEKISIVEKQLPEVLQIDKKQLSESKEPAKPSESEEPSKPNESGEPSKPNESGEPSKPNESEEPSKPNESKESIKPSKSSQPVKPTESKQPDNPSKTKEPTKSSMNKEPAKPSESKQPVICKTASDLDLVQGNAVFQNSLDKWNSHLIGLEYILEIWDKPGGHVKNYHCILCNEDISTPKSFVSNDFVAVHISNIKHMSSYIISEHYKFVS